MIILIPYYPSFKVITYFIKLAMSFMLTLILKKNFHCYLRNCQYADILVAFPGKNFLVSNFAKLSLALLCQHLDRNQLAKSLSLTQSDIHTILKVLSNKVLSEDEQKLFWHVFTKSELLLALKGFCQLKANCVDFVKQGGLSTLAAVLEFAEKEEQEAIVVLLWQLSHLVGPNVVEHGHELMTTLSRLPAVEESNLSALKIVVPHCAFQSLPEGELNFIMIIIITKCIYLFSFFFFFQMVNIVACMQG